MADPVHSGAPAPPRRAPATPSTPTAIDHTHELAGPTRKLRVTFGYGDAEARHCKTICYPLGSTPLCLPLMPDHTTPLTEVWIELIAE